MPAITPTPAHVIDEATIRALHLINSTAVVDTLARNGYDPRYTYMTNGQEPDAGAEAGGPRRDGALRPGPAGRSGGEAGRRAVSGIHSI